MLVLTAAAITAAAVLGAREHNTRSSHSSKLNRQLISRVSRVNIRRFLRMSRLNLGFFCAVVATSLVMPQSR